MSAITPVYDAAVIELGDPAPTLAELDEALCRTVADLLDEDEETRA